MSGETPGARGERLSVQRDAQVEGTPGGATDGASEAQGAARSAEAEAARARAATAAGRMPGTTHDPNSVTTMTDAEPEGDVYPPPGTTPPATEER